MLIEEENKRRLNELNLLAAKKRKSKHTGFIHHCYEDESRDTIPLIENVCYALALFRSRITLNILEAKILLEKLLAFEVEGNFPIYIHEYPECKDRFTALHILPAFYWIYADFSPILGVDLQEKLQKSIERIYSFSKEAPKAFAPRIETSVEESFWTPTTLNDWSHYLLSLQMKRGPYLKTALEKAAAFWHPTIFSFVGEPHLQHQEKGQPEVTLFDLWMGQYYSSFSKRALEDHPIHLRACLIQPLEIEGSILHSRKYVYKMGAEGCAFKLWWGDEKATHTLGLFSKAKMSVSSDNEDGLTMHFALAEETYKEEDPLELRCFYNIHEDHQFYVNSKKATTFHLGDKIEVVSKDLTIEIIFSKEGTGTFLGHVSLANRPYQAKTPSTFEAYDWQVALRTLKREPFCTLIATLKFSPRALP